MSRIGVQPITIPQGVEIKIEDKSNLGGQKVVVKGPLGESEEHLRKNIECSIKDDTLTVTRKDESKFTRSLHGLYRTLIMNMIEGVQKGYSKDLEMVGIGYRAEVKGDEISLTVGATHPYTIKAPEGISFEVKDKVNITVKGIDKQLVGQVAATIRSISKPEPYKGKGIRYVGEYIRRKVGKAAATGDEGE